MRNGIERERGISKERTKGRERERKEDCRQKEEEEEGYREIMRERGGYIKDLVCKVNEE